MNSWPIVALGDVAEFVRGINFKPQDVISVGDIGSVACMRTKNVQKDLDLSDLWAVSEFFVKRQEQILQNGDILVSSANSWNLVGKCCWIPQLPWKATFGGFVSILRAKRSKIEPRYLFHWFSSDRVQTTVRSFGQQTTNISNLNTQRCLKLRIPLPPLGEQKKIADILDLAEALRDKRRAALSQLDELTKSIFTEMFGDPVKNPKNWKLHKVHDVISQIEAGWSANGESRPREENEYAVLKVSAVTQGVFSPEECKVINNDIEFKKVVTPEKGDVLFSRANTFELVGASCLIRENYPYLLLPDKLWKIRVNEEKICPEYFKFVLSCPTIRHEISKRSTGTSGSMYNISMDKFRLIKIAVAPIPLQCEFARRITSMEKLKAAHEASLAELDELFASIQYRAFRGEL